MKRDDHPTGQSWGEHYLCTIAEQSVRIAVALERIAELAEQAAAHEDDGIGGAETARLQASYEAGLKKGRLEDDAESG